MKVTVIPIPFGAFGIIPKRLIKGLDDLEIIREVVIIADYNITKIGLNTEKSPGDLRRLAFT